MTAPGTDPEIEEGGACVYSSSVNISTQLAVDLVHSTLGESGGMLPQENFEI